MTAGRPTQLSAEQFKGEGSADDEADGEPARDQGAPEAAAPHAGEPVRPRT